MFLPQAGPLTDVLLLLPDLRLAHLVTAQLLVLGLERHRRPPVQPQVVVVEAGQDRYGDTSVSE